MWIQSRLFRVRLTGLLIVRIRKQRADEKDKLSSSHSLLCTRHGRYGMRGIPAKDTADEPRGQQSFPSVKVTLKNPELLSHALVFFYPFLNVKVLCDAVSFLFFFFFRFFQ